MASNPGDYLNRAALARNVAKKWGEVHPGYTVRFCTQANLLALADSFYAKALANTEHDGNKKQNSDELRAVNKKITQSVARLKEYIRDEYGVNAEANYVLYGLEKTRNKTYTLPTDNDKRAQRLILLLQKLNEFHNPLAAKHQGLAYWEELKSSHSVAWEASKNMKGTKAELSQSCKAFHKEVGDLLTKLYKQIAIDFEKLDIATTRRSFGFLTETYK